jgi:hypothetical protein
MRIFDHVGIPTGDKQPGEMYVPETRVWVTDPRHHPQRIEFLRFEPETPVSGPVRDMPHVAFRVDNLDREIEGTEILLGPFYATATARVVFVRKDGAVFEFMETSEDWHQPTGDQEK